MKIPSGWHEEVRSHIHKPGYKPSFRLNLFDDADYSLVFDRVRTTGPNRMVLWGRVEGKPGSYALFATKGDVTAAHVFVPGEGTYQVRYAGNGKHWVTQDGKEGFQCLTGEGTPVSSPPAGALASPPGQGGALLSPPPGYPAWIPQTYAPPCNYAGNPTVLDLLVVYTPYAVSLVGQAALDTSIDLAVAYANMAFFNSGVNVELRLTGAASIDYTPVNLSTDLSRLENPLDGYMDDVFTMRDNAGADLVCLVADGTNVGVAEIGKPFFVVGAGGLGNYVFAHELGHALGCGHDRANEPSSVPPLYPFSYGYSFMAQGASYGDIMSYTGGVKIPYYSNPAVSYLGVPTGVDDSQPDSADNARTISWYAPTVAAFRTNTGIGLPSVSISVPADGALFTNPVDVPVTATAVSGSSTAQVDFYGDGVFIGSSLSAPYQFTWSKAPSGDHFLTAHAMDSYGGLTFSCPVSIHIAPSLPPPWQEQDLGPGVRRLGSASYAAGVFTLNSMDNGTDGAADGAHLVYQGFCGDGSLQARFTGLANTAPTARVGLVMRSQLSYLSAGVFLDLDPSGTLRADYVTAQGGTASAVTVGTFPFPVWLRLDRSGNNLAFSHSSDGSNWSPDGSIAIPMPQALLAGLALSSGGGVLENTENTSSVDNVAVSMACDTPSPTQTPTPMATWTPVFTWTPTITPTALPCDLVVPSGAMTLSSGAFSFCSLTVSNGATLVIGGAVTLNVSGNVDIEGVINGKGLGYSSAFEANAGVRPGTNGNTTSGGGGGGGHGGAGGNGGDAAAGGDSNDSIMGPAWMGSAGGGGTYVEVGETGIPGGAGGAALVLNAPNGNVTVNGTIDMGGDTFAANPGSGGGAGGTFALWAKNLYGNGLLEAKGGANAPATGTPYSGGGGGGGRIFFCLTGVNQFTGSADVSGGLAPNAGSLGSGQAGRPALITLPVSPRPPPSFPATLKSRGPCPSQRGATAFAMCTSIQGANYRSRAP